jgi:hypothetical protein
MVFLQRLFWFRVIKTVSSDGRDDGQKIIKAAQPRNWGECERGRNFGV